MKIYSQFSPKGEVKLVLVDIHSEIFFAYQSKFNFSY